MVENLDDLLEAMLESEADKMTLEWVSGGLEVSIFGGSLGVGNVLPEPRATAIVGELITRAKLQRRSTGTFNARIGERERTFTVREYDHFGESAFEIRVRA